MTRGEFSEVARDGKLTKSEFSDDDRGGSLLTLRRIIKIIASIISRFAKLGRSARLSLLELRCSERD